MNKLNRLYADLAAADYVLEEQIQNMADKDPADYRPGLAEALADYQHASQALRDYLSGDWTD